VYIWLCTYVFRVPRLTDVKSVTWPSLITSQTQASIELTSVHVYSRSPASCESYPLTQASTLWAAGEPDPRAPRIPGGYRGPRGDWAPRGWAAYYFESKAERIFGPSINSAVKKKQMCKLHCIWMSTELLSWLGELSSSVNVFLDCFFSVGLSRILMKLGTNDVMVRGYTVAQRILDSCINYANCGKFVENMKWLVDLRLLVISFHFTDFCFNVLRATDFGAL